MQSLSLRDICVFRIILKAYIVMFINFVLLSAMSITGGKGLLQKKTRFIAVFLSIYCIHEVANNEYKSVKRISSRKK